MLQRSTFRTESFLIKQLPQATVFVNTEGEIVLASDKWIQEFSTCEGGSCIGMSLTKLFNKHIKDWRKVLKECLMGEPGQPRVGRYHDENGNEKMVELVKTAWHDDDENVIGWIIQGEKSSQRVLNEVQLDKLHVLSSQMSDIAKIGLWSIVWPMMCCIGPK